MAGRGQCKYWICWLYIHQMVIGKLFSRGLMPQKHKSILSVAFVLMDSIWRWNSLNLWCNVTLLVDEAVWSSLVRKTFARLIFRNNFPILFHGKNLFHLGGVTELVDTLNMGEQVWFDPHLCILCYSTQPLSSGKRVFSDMDEFSGYFRREGEGGVVSDEK